LTNLLLIPTQSEFAVLEPALAAVAQRHAWSIELCGFGPIAAAARTSQLIASRQPDRVLLAGIAGAYASRISIGEAAVFDQVGCYGVGAGTADGHQPAGQIGWPQWQALDSLDQIGDVVELDSVRGARRGGFLLTCCAASASAADIRCRTQLHPEATAEDMEGFGVALACKLAGVAVQIARGISNRAGDRDKATWQVVPALESVANVARTIISQESSW